MSSEDREFEKPRTEYTISIFLESSVYGRACIQQGNTVAAGRRLERWRTRELRFIEFFGYDELSDRILKIRLPRECRDAGRMDDLCE